MRKHWKKAPSFAFIWFFVVVTFAVSARANHVFPKTGNAFPIFTAVAACVLCMSTPRTTWRTSRRIAYVFVTWLGVSVLGLGIMFAAYLPLRLLGAAHHLDVFGNLLAGTGFVIVAMRQSALFVAHGSQVPAGTTAAAVTIP
jgi:hypothetical protein